MKNSITPSIIECERFILYLNKKFNLNLPDNLTVTIHETRRNVKGYFRSEKCEKPFHNTNNKINEICLSSHFLKETPYETIAHETAHFYNYVNDIGDCTKNQYHNKKFKSSAEKLLLKCEKKGSRGFAYTSMTPEFEEMLKTFKPNEKAFRIFQETKEKGKSPNRNILYECSCGIKVRTAFKPFIAKCLHCNTQFEKA